MLIQKLHISTISTGVPWKTLVVRNFTKKNTAREKNFLQRRHSQSPEIFETVISLNHLSFAIMQKILKSLNRH